MLTLSIKYYCTKHTQTISHHITP